jgi:hypothetical protein
MGRGGRGGRGVSSSARAWRELENMRAVVGLSARGARSARWRKKRREDMVVAVGSDVGSDERVSNERVESAQAKLWTRFITGKLVDASDSGPLRLCRLFIAFNWRGRDSDHNHRDVHTLPDYKNLYHRTSRRKRILAFTKALRACWRPRCANVRR